MQWTQALRWLAWRSPWYDVTYSHDHHPVIKLRQPCQWTDSSQLGQLCLSERRKMQWTQALRWLAWRSPWYDVTYSHDHHPVIKLQSRHDSGSSMKGAVSVSVALRGEISGTEYIHIFKALAVSLSVTKGNLQRGLWENLFFDVSQITSSPIAEISHIWKALIKVAERIHW
ncbi:uncharacterized protein [Palaemon carinicauda]|uniref:uncharacterized protein isoform X2 n=1 Tax=Palaemon carinicauda TaxID=392227 RepID=UPI0035B6157C